MTKSKPAADLDFDKNEGEDSNETQEETIQTGKFGVKKTKEGFAVINPEGSVVREYIEEEGCEDPKESAISFAKKLASKK